MMIQKNDNSDCRDFDAVAFFSHLTQNNRLARLHNFDFAIVSGLEGFEDALNKSLEMNALVAVDDSSQGDISLANTPHKKYFKTVYLFMRHSVLENWAKAREQCFYVMREIFRQFCSVIIRERSRLRLENIIIDDKISFNEIDRHFFTGGACAWFQIEIDKFVSLELNIDEWIKDPIPPKLSRLDVNMPTHSTTLS